MAKEVSELTKARIRETKALNTQLEKMSLTENELAKAKKDQLKTLKESRKLQDNYKDSLNDTLGYAKDLGKNIEDFAGSLPLVGNQVKSALNDKFGDLGEMIQNNVVGGLTKAKGGATLFGRAMSIAMGPIGMVAATFAIIVALVIKARNASRDLGKELNVSTKQARNLLVPLKIQEAKFKAMGLDSGGIKTALISMTNEFGSMENVTAKNAASISRMAQNLGTSEQDLVKFNKTMMDLTGSSFDTANNMAQVAANMAKSANVSTGKVLSDMSSNAEDFARFSMNGAEGMAKAAVEAAKVGASLGTVLGAADKLLDFESSITAQFEAQVLTGKNINLEKARQLALDGDMAGLTNEIQSIVGQVGDIQSLNVIQRQSVADSIGISVSDLLKISRGEKIAEQETVQNKLDITNKLLAVGNEDRTELLDENKKDKFSGLTY